MAEKTLVLETKRTRRKVEIDGVAFELLDAKEMDLASGVRLRTLVEIGKKYADLTEAQAREVSAGLKSAAEWMLMGGGEKRVELLAKLSDEQRLTVLINFLEGTSKAHSSPASV